METMKTLMKPFWRPSHDVKGRLHTCKGVVGQRYLDVYVKGTT
jgi:hypothetical protein